jgi:hypothetical protein
VIISLGLILFVTVSGTIASYLYDDDAPFIVRVCAGVCTGMAALGLIAFIISSFIGLTPLAILFTCVLLTLPGLALKNGKRRGLVLRDLRRTYAAVRNGLIHPGGLPLAYVLFYFVVVVILWRVFQRAMIELPEGIYTGLLNNFGDLPFHLSVITSFAFGNNLPPEDPTYAGVRFTYPFLTDFISAIFVRCGASLRESMFLENFVVALAFVGLLHRWALVMLRDRLAAFLTPVVALLNGGLGWTLLWQAEIQHRGNFSDLLKSLPASFTVIPETTWRWGNAFSALLVPQRGFLLGLPLAVIVFTQWWLSGEPTEAATPAKLKTKKNKSSKREESKGVLSEALALSSTYRLSSPLRRMIAAGIVAGLLPLVHAHSFVVVMVVGFCIALLQRRWIPWIVFLAVASLVAVPQMWWSTHHSAVDAGKFFEWQYGWDRGKENAVTFWLWNSGVFIPLTIVALLWRSKHGPLVPRKLAVFLLPFTLCFIVPNVLKMAPWIWDNIKVLYYWWVGSAPLVGLLLAHLWRKNRLTKLIASVLIVCVTGAGALDVAGIILRSDRYQVFDASGIAFADSIKQGTAPRALVMHAPVHNDPVFLTGRRSLMGYPGHIWTHGLEFAPRESEIRRAYAGTAEAPAILGKYGVDYVVVSPLERNLMTVNDQFFSKFRIVGEVGGYRLYKITP